MPYSSNEGKWWMRERILDSLRIAAPRFDPEGEQLAPRVLDIGAGSGTYAKLLCTQTDLPIHITAIEIYAPYVERFHLRAAYDEVIVGDARLMDLPTVEVVIFGDVLEHMPAADAAALWRKARAAATRSVYASLPIVEWPQGESEGNPHEAHVETWTHERVMAELNGIEVFQIGTTIGCYRASGLRGVA